jgi:hypothetical protein
VTHGHSEGTESHLSRNSAAITDAWLESELQPLGLVSVGILATGTLVVLTLGSHAGGAWFESQLQHLRLLFRRCCFETQLGHRELP